MPPKIAPEATTGSSSKKKKKENAAAAEKQKQKKLALAKKQAEEKGEEEKPMDAKHIKKRPLFISVFIVMLIPGVVLLNRGIEAMRACEDADKLCLDNCDVEWEKLLDTLQGNERYVRRERKEELRTCQGFCGGNYGQCSMESALFVLAAGLISASFFCTVWLFSMTKGLLVRLDEIDQDEKAAEMDQKKNIGKKKIATSPGHGRGKKFVAKPGQAIRLLDDEDLENPFDDMGPTCVKCGFEMTKKYATATPKITSSTTWKSAPLYCPNCKCVQHGFL